MVILLAVLIILIGIAATSFFILPVWASLAIPEKVSKAHESFQEQGHTKAVTEVEEDALRKSLSDKPLTDFFPLIEAAIKNGDSSRLNIYLTMMEKAYDREEEENGFVCQNSLGWYKYWDSCARFVLGYYNNCPKESGIVSEVGHEISGNRDDNWIKLNNRCFSGGQYTIIYSESSNEILPSASYGYDYTKIIAQGDKIKILYDIPSGYTDENVRTLAIIIDR